MPDIIIRRAILSDGPQLPRVFETAIREIASRFYCPAQVEAWAARAWRLQEVFEGDFNARAAWVAANPEVKIQAYIDLEGGGHIDFFYALPSVTKSSITRDMYAFLETEARAQGVAELTTEASEAARRFFEKQGFEITHKQDVWIGETCLHNYKMRKALK